MKWTDAISGSRLILVQNKVFHSISFDKSTVLTTAPWSPPPFQARRQEQLRWQRWPRWRPAPSWARRRPPPHPSVWNQQSLGPFDLGKTNVIQGLYWWCRWGQLWWCWRKVSKKVWKKGESSTCLKLLVIVRNYEIIRTTFQENWSNPDNYLTIAVLLALKFSLCWSWSCWPAWCSPYAASPPQSPGPPPPPPWQQLLLLALRKQLREKCLFDTLCYDFVAIMAIFVVLKHSQMFTCTCVHQTGPALSRKTTANTERRQIIIRGVKIKKMEVEKIEREKFKLPGGYHCCFDPL